MRKFFMLSLCFICISVYGNVRLPALFTDGMVLQQQTEVVIWGWAATAEKIKLNTGWDHKDYIVISDDKGRWEVRFTTPKAGGPFAITVAGRNLITINNVLIGEVWLCSGQSNMVFSLKSSAGAAEAIAKADYPAIRYFSVARQYGLQDYDDAPGSKWESTSPSTAGSFSAVAFYFAKKLQDELHVPVGIIYSAWGGTPAEAWTPQTVLITDTTLKQYLQRWKDIQQNAGPDSTRYLQQLADWKLGDTTKTKRPAEPQSLYYYHRPWREPSVLYNGMIDPVIPYSLKGIVWYQGESNVAYANEYQQLLTALITSWRERWNKQLPFYIVEIATNKYADMDAAARLRDAQQIVASTIPHAGVVVTTDVGEMGDIHYKRKKEVGDRLAWMALHHNYAKKKIIFKGPEIKNAALKGKTVKLQYTSPDIVVDGAQVQGFELGYRNANDSIIYKPAMARLNKDHSIDVWADENSTPVSVRFAWLYPDKANLFNRQGLPAFPFSRDL